MTISLKTRLFYMVALCWVLCFNVGAQADLSPGYDIGVFYMPYWHSDAPDGRYPDPYTSFSQTQHHWYQVDAYDRWLVSNYKFDKVRIPSAIYYQAGNGAALGPSAWYNENLKKVTEKQLELMSQYGIDFVIYDSYFGYINGDWRPYWNKVIDNWLPNNGPGNPDNWDPVSAPLNNHGVEMAIFWVEHDKNKIIGRGCDAWYNSGQGLDKMIAYWAEFMKLPSYKKTSDGRPYFYLPESVVLNTIVGDCKNHAFFAGAGPGSYYVEFAKTRRLLEYMNAKFKQHTGSNKDVYFVAVHSPDANMISWNEKWVWHLRWPDEAGFDASTSLRYDTWDETDRTQFSWPPSYQGYDYDRMTSITKEYYDYTLDNNYSGYPNTNVDYQIHVNAGWDNSPTHYHNRNNSSYPYHGYPAWDYKNGASDHRKGDPHSFGLALSQAKNYADSYPDRTNKTITIYAWNEHTEGSVISPTHRWGYQYLDKIASVFGGQSRPAQTAEENAEVPEVLSNEIRVNADLNNQSLIHLSLSLTRSSDMEVQVIDLQGRVLQQELFSDQPKGHSEVQLQLNFEAQGLYLVKVSALGINKTQKIIVD